VAGREIEIGGIRGDRPRRLRPVGQVHSIRSGLDAVRGWSFASGKRPSRAEYAALVASCRQGAVQSARGKPLEVCLADLGLRRD
jgi:hypothetical protein